MLHDLVRTLPMQDCLIGKLTLRSRTASSRAQRLLQHTHPVSILLPSLGGPRRFVSRLIVDELGARPVHDVSLDKMFSWNQGHGAWVNVREQFRKK